MSTEAQVRFTPQMYINHYAAQRGITVEEIGVAPVVVISWSPRVIETLIETLAASVGAQLAVHWPWVKHRRFYSGAIGDQRVSFAQVGIGASATVSEMEEMIACGARTFLGLVGR
jgi:uridine phosphorylase